MILRTADDVALIVAAYRDAVEASDPAADENTATMEAWLLRLIDEGRGWDVSVELRGDRVSILVDIDPEPWRGM